MTPRQRADRVTTCIEERRETFDGSRRLADVADRFRGRLSWAESATTGAASGMTGVRAIASVPFEREIGFIA